MEKTDEKVSILIVDDDENICKSLALILRKKGYAVETAGTGHEALEKAKEGFFNVALLDIKLPDMEGIELISPLKELHPDIDMFMITAYASLETAVEALNKGATAYFLKPPDMDEVLVSVKDALEKQRLVRENRMLLKAVQKELAERKQAEEALIKARDELELRVVERTNELAEANVKLQDDITKRKQAEEELRDSEEHYRELVEKAGIAIAIDDQEGNIVYFNNEFLKIFGYSPDEIKQHTIRSFVHPDDVEMVVSYHQARMQGKEAPTRYEFRGIKQDGTTVFLEVDVVCLRKGKSIIGTRSYFWDITERKKIEEMLKESEAKHRNILESIEEGYFEVDLAGNLTFFNDSLCRMVGFSRSELMGMNNREFTSPETAKKMYEAFNEMYRTGKPLKLIDCKLIRADGNTQVLEMSASLMRDPSGEPIGFRGVVRDITERKRAEEALRSSQEYSQNIVDSSLDMIIAVDNRRRITAFNAAAVKTFGYEYKEVLGKHVNLLYADPKEGLRIHKMTVKQGQYIQEILNRRRNGVLFPCLLSASVLRDADGNKVGVMGVSRDITERKQAEEKLRHYASELERSNKELQQFTHAVSHDLQEPLRTIRSYLQLLADRYQQQLDEDADTFIAYAVEGAERMQELIRGLLASSQVEIQAQDFEPKDCEEVLETILANLQVTIKEAQVQVTHDPLPTVMADGPQMGQLFQNLIENAIKFRKEEPPCVHISAREERDHWLFSVRDNGIGIDPGQSERIFEIFQRLAPRNEYPGTGIGLTICKKIVERHGGKIWVESTPGKGSTFYFTIVK